MNKKLIISIVLLIVIVCWLVYIAVDNGGVENKFEGVNTSATSTKNINFDPLNFTYDVEGQKIKIENGNSIMDVVPGSAEKLETTIPDGMITIGDLNKDNKNDAALILVQSSGGTGLFYYLTSIVNDAGVIKNKGSVFIGDRILIENIIIEGGIVTLNYLDRKESDSMADEPSVKIVKRFKIAGDSLEEIK